MNAYTLAAQLLADVELSTGQLAQLRAIDMKYQQQLFTLLHRRGADAAAPADVRVSSAGVEREPTPDELATLRETIVSDLLSMLTPEQRDALRPH